MFALGFLIVLMYSSMGNNMLNHAIPPWRNPTLLFSLQKKKIRLSLNSPFFQRLFLCLKIHSLVLVKTGFSIDTVKHMKEILLKVRTVIKRNDV